MCATLTLAAALAAPAVAQDYVVIELYPLAGVGGVTVNGVNAHGEIVGTAVISTVPKAFVWLPNDAYGLDAGMNLLNDNFSGFVSSRAFDINDAGLVVGTVEYSGGRFPYIWDLAGSSDQFINVAVSGFAAYGINDETNPIIVGGKFLDPDITGTDCVDTPGFIYDLAADQLDSLPVPASISGEKPVAFGVNTPASGNYRVAGSTYQVPGVLCDGFNQCLEEMSGAFWDDGTSLNADELKEVGMGQFNAGVVGYAVNADGLVVGSGHDSDDTFGPMDDQCRRRAVVWDASDPSANVDRLANLSSTDEDDAFDIRGTESNLPMEVVGWSILNQEALLWRWNDTSSSWDLVQLNSDACTTGIVSLRRAEAINADGWVAGHTLGTGWLLIPEDDYHANVCPADFANNNSTTCPEGQVDVFDLFVLLGNWGTDGDGAALANPTNIVDVFDLFELLNSWGVCIGDPPPSPGLQTVVENAGLTMDDWDEFEDVMAGEDEKPKETYNCWMQRYLSGCTTCPPCPGGRPV